MIQLDDRFLAEVGLADLPADARQSLLQHVYEELALRVGSAMTDGLSDSQIAEFEAIIDRDYERIAAWLDANAPDFLNDVVYQRMEQALRDTAKQADIVCQYASTKWLELNRPDHRVITEAVFEELKAELRSESARLLDKS